MSMALKKAWLFCSYVFDNGIFEKIFQWNYHKKHTNNSEYI